MSGIDHVAAIKQEADRLYHMALIQEADRDQLYLHADALAAEKTMAVSDALAKGEKAIMGLMDDASSLMNDARSLIAAYDVRVLCLLEAVQEPHGPGVRCALTELREAKRRYDDARYRLVSA